MQIGYSKVTTKNSNEYRKKKLVTHSWMFLRKYVWKYVNK